MFLVEFGGKLDSFARSYLLQLVIGFAMVLLHSFTKLFDFFIGGFLLRKFAELHLHHAALGGFLNEIRISAG